MINGLLICPICTTEDKRIVLGSVDTRGYLYIERYRGSGGTTVIMSKQSFITHHCGFGTAISSPHADHVSYSFPTEN